MDAQRRTLSGEVVSTKMTDTAVVNVITFKIHPKYEKRMKSVKKFLAHNPGNVFKVGDKVILEETRPMSKMKRFRIKEKIAGV